MNTGIFSKLSQAPDSVRSIKGSTIMIFKPMGEQWAKATKRFLIDRHARLIYFGAITSISQFWKALFMKRIHTISLILVCLVLGTGVCRAKTALTWWQFWTDPSIRPTIQTMVSEFEKENPDISVKMTDLTWANGHEKIVVSFASGTAPDILELGSDWIAQFAANGQLADLSDEVAADSAEFQGWSMATYEGGVYARPWILGTRVIFMNTDLLKRAGYEPTWLPVSLRDLFEASQRIDSLGEDIYGWGSNTAEKHRLYKKFLPFFWSSEARIFDDAGDYCVISSVHSVMALSVYKLFHDQGGYVANQRGIEDAFLDGKIGVIMSGDWLLKRIELENRKINFSTTLFPGDNGPGKSFLGGEFLAINADSDKKEAAGKFIRFMTSPENQVTFCKANRTANPSSRVAQQDSYFQSSPHLQTFIKQIAFANHPPVDPDWVYIEDIIERAVEDALFGQGLPGEAMLDAQHEITRLMSAE
jgi:multiple sugar transport system substrate-binding protein